MEATRNRVANVFRCVWFKNQLGPDWSLFRETSLEDRTVTVQIVAARLLFKILVNRSKPKTGFFFVNKTMVENLKENQTHKICVGIKCQEWLWRRLAVASGVNRLRGPRILSLPEGIVEHHHDGPQSITEKGFASRQRPSLKISWRPKRDEDTYYLK